MFLFLYFIGFSRPQKLSCIKLISQSHAGIVSCYLGEEKEKAKFLANAFGPETK